MSPFPGTPNICQNCGLNKQSFHRRKDARRVASSPPPTPA